MFTPGRLPKKRRRRPLHGGSAAPKREKPVARLYGIHSEIEGGQVPTELIFSIVISIPNSITVEEGLLYPLTSSKTSGEH